MLFTGSNSIIIYLPQPLDGAPSLFQHLTHVLYSSCPSSFDASAELLVTCVLANFFAIYKDCKAFAHHHELDRTL